jgi:RNA polymerase sigma factor (sigma-70 family)
LGLSPARNRFAKAWRIVMCSLGSGSLLTVISCLPDGVLVLLFPFGHAQGVFGVSQVAAVHWVGPGLMEDPDRMGRAGRTVCALIWSLCRRYRLDAADAGGVGQNVWLQLVNQLGNTRDPAALPGWLATTTRRECQRVLNRTQAPHAALHAPDADNIPDEQANMVEPVLAAERHAALRDAFAHLPPCCQQLSALLIKDPLTPYAQVSARLGTPIGSIGRTAAGAWTSYAITRPSPR